MTGTMSVFENIFVEKSHVHYTQSLTLEIFPPHYISKFFLMGNSSSFWSRNLVDLVYIRGQPALSLTDLIFFFIQSSSYGWRGEGASISHERSLRLKDDTLLALESLIYKK